MRTMAVGAALVAVAAAAAMGTVRAAAAEDDLAVVKRAVSVQVPARAPEKDTLERRSEAPPAEVSSRDLRWFKVRITEKGAAAPKVSVTMPFALAELVFKSLPDEALQELKGEGYDAATFWKKLRDLGPTDVIDIEGDEGERIRIWIE